MFLWPGYQRKMVSNDYRGRATREKQLTSFSQVKARKWLIWHIISRTVSLQCTSVSSMRSCFRFFNGGKSLCHAGCSNGSNRVAGITLHASPTDKSTRDSWIRFVRTKQKNFHPSLKTQFVICSVHFEESCFTRAFDPSQRRQIKPRSLPTIWKTGKRTKVQESERSLRMKEKARQKVSL